jgi:ribosomal protein S24E
MEIKVENKIKQNLFDREEIVLKITNTLTPSKAQIKEEVSKMTKKPQENIVIKKIAQEFGKKEVIVNVYVYNDAALIKRYQRKPRKKKGAQAAAEPAK